MMTTSGTEPGSVSSGKGLQGWKLTYRVLHGIMGAGLILAYITSHGKCGARYILLVVTPLSWP